MMVMIYNGIRTTGIVGGVVRFSRRQEYDY